LEQRADLAGRTEAVSNTDAARIGDRVTGGDRDRVETAGLSRGPRPGQGLQNGDFLHNPRDVTPEQARDLEKLGKDPSLHPDTRREIQEFLDDYHNGIDRLFPDAPNPYPRPYPSIPRDPVG
jgi:hypothetical protein